MTNYDVTRVKRITAEYGVISSFVKKFVQNREKSTNGDYYQTLSSCSTADVNLLSINVYVYVIFSYRWDLNNGQVHYLIMRLSYIHLVKNSDSPKNYSKIP